MQLILREFRIPAKCENIYHTDLSQYSNSLRYLPIYKAINADEKDDDVKSGDDVDDIDEITNMKADDMKSSDNVDDDTSEIMNTKADDMNIE